MKEKNNNKGFTLIELIVVLAIMMVLTAATATSLVLISKQRVSNAASSTKQMIQLAQTYAKSKSNCCVMIEGTEDGTGVYVYTYDSDGNLKYGSGPSEISKKISTTVVYNDGSEVEISDGTQIYIDFDRTTGGFVTVTDKTPDNGVDEPGVGLIPTQIKFSNGSKEAALNLATHTGVITYE